MESKNISGYLIDAALCLSIALGAATLGPNIEGCRQKQEQRIERILDYTSFGEFRKVLGERKLKASESQAKKFWESLNPKQKKIFFECYTNPALESLKTQKYEGEEYNQFLKNKENAKYSLPWEDDIKDSASPANLALYKAGKDFALPQSW